jgi:epimerase transport system membrane fusion protein
MPDNFLAKLPILLPAKRVEATEDAGLPMDERPYRLLGIGVVFLTFVVFGLWAAFAPLNSAVVAVGQVTVASQNKQVQHLDGGIVKAIHVYDGDTVTAGQVLLELEDTQWRSQLENVQGQLWDADATLVRLAAERDGADTLSWPADLQKAPIPPVLAEILKTQFQLFTVRRQALAAGQDVLAQRLAQTQKQLEGTENQITSLRNRRNSLGDDVKSLEKLAGQNLVAKSTLHQNQRDYEELVGDTTKAVSEVARLGEVLAETKQQMLLSKGEYLKEVGAGISDFQTKRIQLLAQKQSLEDKLSRVAITAPVAGKVKGLNMVTLGGVISAGQVIMEVVPNEQEFKIIAQLSPTDIDSITPGQVAEIKFSLFNDARYFPVIYADLVDISADTLINQSSHMPYYKATLSIHEDGVIFLKKKGINLVPGMPAEVLLQTGQNSLLNYLFKPLTNVISHAFNES